MTMRRSKKWRVGLASALIWGSGQLWNKQYVKALFFFLCQVGLVFALPSLRHGLWGLFTLGETEMIINGSSVTQGDNSIILLILGILWALVTILFIGVYIGNIRDAINDRGILERGEPLKNVGEWIHDFREKSFPYAMLTPAVILIALFVVVPITFGFLIAFTNYSAPNYLPPRSLLDWVGFRNFTDMFKLPLWNDTFWGVLLWTLIWALGSTATCYFGGLGMAILVNHRRVRGKKFWRTVYILPWAIPGMISLLIFRNMFNGQFGPINTFLRDAGIIAQNIPWLSDATLAKIDFFVVNFWLGFPYFMTMMSGVMTSISPELLEAARIDGATPRQEFRHITLPIVLFSTAPLLIMSFAMNFNNFNVIYFLTNGNPINPEYKFAGSTDILITWIYKLTNDNRQFQMAAVMSILVFIVIATISTWNFLRTKSFKEEDMMG